MRAGRLFFFGKEAVNGGANHKGRVRGVSETH